MAIDKRLKDVHIDWTAEFMYGHDQVYDSFPCVFPTVNLVIYGEGLCSLADDVLKDNGESEEALGQGYDFYIGLNGYTKSHVDTIITVISDGYWDGYCSEESYQIPLSTEEQNFLYNLLDEQLRKGGHEYGVDYKTSCEELLEESAKDFEKHTGDKLTILDRSA